MTDGGGVIGIILKAGKTGRFGIEAVEPVAGAYPDGARLVLADTTYIIIADAVRIQGVIAVNQDLVPVEPVEPVAGAQPDKSPVVLENALDGTVRQPLFQ